MSDTPAVGDRPKTAEPFDELYLGRLATELGFRADPGGWWTGRCFACDAEALTLTLTGYTCGSCGDGGIPLDLESLVQARANGAAPDPRGTPTFALLRELLARPELLALPECVLPRLGYRGRCVLLAGPDKSGKSTIVADGASALTLGQSWLGEATTTGRVVWMGLEEAIGDAVRRFSALGADPDRVQLVTMTPPDLYDRTQALLGDWPADLLVVDSLAEYARITLGHAPDDGDSAGWGTVVRPLVALARLHDIAVVLLHHVRRSDGQARGSGEILAAVDATYELQLPVAGQDPTERRIRGRGRWHIEPVRVALRDGRYELASAAELSTDALVLLHVERDPGISATALRSAIQARASVVDAAVHRLVERGGIVDRGTGEGRARRSAFYPAETGQGALELGEVDA